MVHGTRVGLRDAELLRDRAFVDGAWAAADDGHTFGVHDPATGDLIAEVPRMGAAETRRAIGAAAAAFPAWRATPAAGRATVLRCWADLMREHRDDLALLLTHEQGKPLRESEAEVAYAAAFFEWFGEEAKRIDGDVIPSPQADKRVLVTKHPIGVCGGITPWNFPAAMVTRKSAPALAAGNTMVLKPAEQTPLSALAVAELGRRAGLPPGVLSIVTGDAEDAPAIGGELTGNPAVRKLGFTGSTAVGKLLMRQCADQVRNVSLELGGNAPFIVFADADLDAAVAGAVLCKFRNSGQTCITANRILVHEGVHTAFLERFVAATRSLTVGAGTDPAPARRPAHRPRGAGEGRAPRGRRAAPRRPAARRRRAPRARPHVLPAHRARRGRPGAAMSNEETFGPVAGVSRFDSEDEAIRAANDTPYGLAAYFYTRDVGRIFRVSEALEYGILGINTGFISTEVAPFGGVKESGLGREGSKYGINDWIELKYLSLGGIA